MSLLHKDSVRILTEDIYQNALKLAKQCHLVEDTANPFIFEIKGVLTQYPRYQAPLHASRGQEIAATTINTFVTITGFVSEFEATSVMDLASLAKQFGQSTTTPIAEITNEKIQRIRYLIEDIKTIQKHTYTFSEQDWKEDHGDNYDEYYPIIKDYEGYLVASFLNNALLMLYQEHALALYQKEYGVFESTSRTDDYRALKANNEALSRQETARLASYENYIEKIRHDMFSLQLSWPLSSLVNIVIKSILELKPHYAVDGSPITSPSQLAFEKDNLAGFAAFKFKDTINDLKLRLAKAKVDFVSDPEETKVKFNEQLENLKKETQTCLNDINALQYSFLETLRELNAISEAFNSEGDGTLLIQFSELKKAHKDSLALNGRLRAQLQYLTTQTNELFQNIPPQRSLQYFEGRDEPKPVDLFTTKEAIQTLAEQKQLLALLAPSPELSLTEAEINGKIGQTKLQAHDCRSMLLLLQPGTTPTSATVSMQTICLIEKQIEQATLRTKSASFIQGHREGASEVKQLMDANPQKATTIDAKRTLVDVRKDMEACKEAHQQLDKHTVEQDSLKQRRNYLNFLNMVVIPFLADYKFDLKTHSAIAQNGLRKINLLGQDYEVVAYYPKMTYTFFDKKTQGEAYKQAHCCKQGLDNSGMRHRVPFVRSQYTVQKDALRQHLYDMLNEEEQQLFTKSGVFVARERLDGCPTYNEKKDLKPMRIAIAKVIAAVDLKRTAANKEIAKHEKSAPRTTVTALEEEQRALNLEEALLLSRQFKQQAQAPNELSEKQVLCIQIYHAKVLAALPQLRTAISEGERRLTQHRISPNEYSIALATHQSNIAQLEEYISFLHSKQDQAIFEKHWPALDLSEEDYTAFKTKLASHQRALQSAKSRISYYERVKLNLHWTAEHKNDHYAAHTKQQMREETASNFSKGLSYLVHGLVILAGAINFAAIGYALVQHGLINGAWLAKFGWDIGTPALLEIFTGIGLIVGTFAGYAAANRISAWITESVYQFFTVDIGSGFAYSKSTIGSMIGLVFGLGEAPSATQHASKANTASSTTNFNNPSAYAYKGFQQQPSGGTFSPNGTQKQLLWTFGLTKPQQLQTTTTLQLIFLAPSSV